MARQRRDVQLSTPRMLLATTTLAFALPVSVDPLVCTRYVGRDVTDSTGHFTTDRGLPRGQYVVVTENGLGDIDQIAGAVGPEAVADSTDPEHPPSPARAREGPERYPLLFPAYSQLPLTTAELSVAFWE